MSCEHDDLRLPCPTCGGDGGAFVGEPHHLPDCDCTWDQTPCAQQFDDCPDCTDGRMSHERAWKIVAAVFDGRNWPKAMTADAAEFIDYLRGVR